MHRRWLVGLAFIALVGSAAAQPIKPPPAPPPRPQPERPAPAVAPSWDHLERFSGEAEFMAYLRDVRRVQVNAQRRRSQYAPGTAEDSVATPSPMSPPPPPPPPPPSVQGAQMSGLAAGRADNSASVPEGSSVTNVQTQGVDEGGIVKQIGRFLVVLQDGRLFVADMRPGNAAGLRLTARANVYRNARDQMWYDEMLTSGNRILVTGYSYRESATEVTIFTIDDNGQLNREAVYYLSSNDYYSGENYATRLVNGNLVIYTPLNVAYMNPEQPMHWPLVRRWLRDGERQAVTTPGRALFDARDIYKPIRPTVAPFVHSVSVCPLGSLRAGDEFECTTTAFVGAQQREFFVSPTDIYLWVTPGWGDNPNECNTAVADRAVPATLFQVPLSRMPPRAIFTRGVPKNQFALDANGGEFRALLDFDTSPCGRNYNAAASVRYFHVPLSSLSTTPITASSRAYVETPEPGTRDYEPRFTERYLVYGAHPGYGSYPQNTSTQTGRVVTVSLARPYASTVLEAPHGVIRIERAGGDIVLTGYRNDDGLSISLLDLDGARPTIADTHLLNGRFEAENRSHAFNALVGRDGNGIMGLPVVTRVKQSGRWVARSDSSDLTFLSVDPIGRLREMGELTSSPHPQDASYRCEVSCIDWYGNSRAIFTGGRVFALSGTELIEGSVSEGRIGELRRLNLSAPPPRARIN